MISLQRQRDEAQSDLERETIKRVKVFRNIRLFLANRFPLLGAIRRLFWAIVYSSLTPRSSYSQYGEDAYIVYALGKYDLTDSIFVDVGANHPCVISNTYLLYRKGLHGVVVEPNRELLRLHRWFRRRDTAIGIGCGRRCSLAKFQIFTTPGMSSFSGRDVEQTLAKNIRIWFTDYVPILPLDTVLEQITYDWICFLSIDTEGLDCEVLLGAKTVLKKTFFVCVETNNEKSRKTTIELMRLNGFDAVKHSHCNVILRNTSEEFDKYLK